jgi:hypothetical protein
VTWWAVTGSNRRHPACKAGALPTELTARICAVSVPLTLQARSDTVFLMDDHLGVNDIPKAKSLENNDRSTALTVNGAGTSPHICAETVPSVREVRILLAAIERRFPGDEQIAARIRTAHHQCRLRAGGDESPEIHAEVRKVIRGLHGLIASRTSTVHARAEP